MALNTPAEGRYAVRVRVDRCSWISPPDTHETASKLRGDLLAQLGAGGDEHGFVEFAAVGGREITVRAVDVVAVELTPWTEHPPAGTVADHGVTVGNLWIQPGRAETGTDWLRQLSRSGRRWS